MRALSFLIIAYFVLAPVYEQPILPAAALYGLKMAFLVLVVVVGLGRGLSAGSLSFGADDLVFLLIVGIALLYTLRGQDLAYMLSLGYVFYCLGKTYLRQMGPDVMIDALVNVARISAIYSLYMVTMYFMSGRASFVTVLNPNTWALYGAIASALLLYHFSREESKMDLLLIVPILISIAVSGSRGGVLMVVSLIFILLASQRNWKVIIGLGVMGVVSFLVFNSVMDLSEFRLFVQFETLRQGGDMDLTTGRMDGYLIALRLIPDNMFFGAGDVDLNWYGLDYRRVHNFYLRLWLEFGLVYFIPFFVFMLMLIRNILLVPGAYKVLSLMVVVILLLPLLYEPSGLFGNFLVAGTLWFIAGMLTGIAKLNRPVQRGGECAGCVGRG